MKTEAEIMERLINEAREYARQWANADAGKIIFELANALEASEARAERFHADVNRVARESRERFEQEHIRLNAYNDELRLALEASSRETSMADHFDAKDRFHVVVEVDGEVYNGHYGPSTSRAIERYTSAPMMGGQYCVRLLAHGIPVSVTVEQLRTMLAIAEQWEYLDPEARERLHKEMFRHDD